MLGTRCLRYHLTSRSARAIATSGRISLLYYEERILPSLLSLANSSYNITERLYYILCSRLVILELALLISFIRRRKICQISSSRRPRLATTTRARSNTDRRLGLHTADPAVLRFTKNTVRTKVDSAIATATRTPTTRDRRLGLYTADPAVLRLTKKTVRTKVDSAIATATRTPTTRR